jgi:hypothetical protein
MLSFFDMDDGNTKLILGLVNLGLVLLAIGAVVAIVGLFGNGHLSVNAEYPQSEIRLPPGVSLKNNPRVSLDVGHPTSRQRLLSFAEAVVTGALIAVGLWLLRGIAVSVRAHDPFNAANVRRLRGLAVLLILGTPVAGVINELLQYQLVNSLPSARYGDAMPSGGLNLPLPAMLAGVGAFILGEVFAYGVRLREDVEATI